MNESPRLLVVQTAFLGDVVLTTPLLKALKEHRPGAYLAVLVIPETAAVLEGAPFVDDLVVHDKRGGGLRELRRVIREVRARKFDVVVSPHRSARSAIIAWRSGAPRRLGYRESALPRLYTERVPRPREGHETRKILALAEALGCHDSEARPVLVATEAERGAAREAAGGRRYVVISPSSVWPTKRWLPEGFAAVGDHLARRGYAVMLTGGPAETKPAAAVAAAMEAPATNVAGRTTPRELAALVAEAALVVANDSAPVHLASAFDTPTVAVFGATVPAQGFGPLASRSAVSEVEGLYCRPCGAHGGRRCPEKHFRCMRELTPAGVIATVDRVAR
ncbi:MAG: glycosyltransferase family 9 protein [Candidatus Coatesbacteria bacterium]|nr:MAG: glycosyltransferase family 9 protein [Candidatus Coatesbacteria bacterium]